MFKFIGVVVVLAVVAMIAAVGLGFVNFNADASVTEKGIQQVQDLRSTVADQVRGK